MVSWRLHLAFVAAMCMAVVQLGQLGCAPKDPCKSCRTGELCKGTLCIPVPVADGVLPDGSVGTDQPQTREAAGPTDTSGGNDQPKKDGPTGPDPKASCAGDGDCPSGKRCVQGECLFGPPAERTVSDAGGSEGPAPERRAVPERGAPETPAEKPPADTPPPPQCKDDSDCGTLFTCKNGKCERKASACQPACATGETCTNGVCEKPNSTPDLGQLCGPTSKCKAGLTCLETDRSHSYCFKACKDSTECKGNKLGEICVQLTQNQRFCVDIVKAGDKCGFKDGLQALCPKDYLCSSGTCKKSKEVKLYGKCGVDAKVCPTGLLCLRLGGGQHGYCVHPCTPGGAKCKDSGECITLSGGSGACLPTGTGAHDVICGGTQTGDSIDRSKFCKPGLDCVQLPNHAICVEFWDGDCKTAGKTCPSGRTCQVLLGGNGKKFGSCLADCSNGSCPKTHLECRKSNNNTCWPKK